MRELIPLNSALILGYAVKERIITAIWFADPHNVAFVLEKHLTCANDEQLIVKEP